MLADLLFLDHRELDDQPVARYRPLDGLDRAGAADRPQAGLLVAEAGVVEGAPDGLEEARVDDAVGDLLAQIRAVVVQDEAVVRAAATTLRWVVRATRVWRSASTNDGSVTHSPS